MARKNIGDTDWSGLALKAGIAVGAYFVIVKPLLSDLGVTPDPATAAVAKATATPGTPFDPNFYNDQQHNVTILTTASAQAFATTIYNALNTWFINDFNAVYGVFTSLTTQSQVSFLAATFQQMYNKDLMTWLEYANGNEATSGTGSNIFTGAFLGGGLTDAQVNQIVTYVNALPNT